MKALGELEHIVSTHFDSGFSFGFDSPAHLPGPLLRLNRTDSGYGGEPVLNGISLSLGSGTHYGLLGTNDGNRSTFVKTLADKLNVSSGRIIRLDRLNTGYFTQYQFDTLCPGRSPLWYI